MLSQSLLGPIIKKITQMYDEHNALRGSTTTLMKQIHHVGKKEVPVFREDVFSPQSRVASTSELLRGYHVERADTLASFLLGLEDAGETVDPLAFAVGLHYKGKDAEPIKTNNLIPDMHVTYNAAAIRLLEDGKVPLFGLRQGFSKGRYVGNLDNPSLVASQISGWMFTRPTIVQARILYQALADFHEKQISKTVKDRFTEDGVTKTNDMRILDAITGKIIKEKGWTLEEDVEKELKSWMPADAPLSREEVVAIIGPRDKLSIGSERALEDFYDEVGKANTVEGVVGGAKILIDRIVLLERTNTDGTKQMNSTISTLRAEIRSLRGEVTRLKQPATESIPSGTKNMSFGFEPESRRVDAHRPPRLAYIGSVVGKRLCTKGRSLLSKHAHPEIVQSAFSADAIAHFDAMTSRPKEIEKKQELSTWLL